MPSTPVGRISASRRWQAVRSKEFPFKPRSRQRTAGDLGEFKLLGSLRRYFDQPSKRLLIAAPEDDAALWRGDRYVVATTDTLVEDVDFRMNWPGFDFRLLGRRLMSINLSDLAGMGAKPRHALISLALRRDTRLGDIDRLYQGISQRAHQYGCTIAGGDLSSTAGPLTLTAAVFGSVPSATRVLRRRRGRPGWQIAVTGTLGGAAAGLRLLESKQKPRTPAERAWVRAQLDPQPQLEAGQMLVSAGVRVGGDISDGLFREVERITELDGLGATIQLEALPLARGIGYEDWPLAVRDSEDFQLICAAPQATIERAQRALQRRKLRLTVVGVVERQPDVRLRDGGRSVTLSRAGYEHFR